MKTLGLIVASLLLSACGLRQGPINNPPAPEGSEELTRVTVSRVPSIMGWPWPMIFTIDGEEIYGLDDRGSYGFLLEPGQYIFGYYLAFNECRHLVKIERKPSQHILLATPCKIVSTE